MTKSKQTPRVLSAPDRHENIPENAQWLAGEGAGSWFVLQPADEAGRLNMQRLSPEGSIECEGILVSPADFNLNMDYEVTYPSFCNVVTVIQHTKKITLNRIES